MNLDKPSTNSDDIIPYTSLSFAQLEERRIGCRSKDHPWYSMPFEKQQVYDVGEASRLRQAVYFDPLYDSRFFDFRRFGWPRSLAEKTGNWYLPDPKGKSGSFCLRYNEMAAIAFRIVGKQNYCGPPIDPNSLPIFLEDQIPVGSRAVSRIDLEDRGMAAVRARVMSNTVRREREDEGPDEILEGDQLAQDCDEVWDCSSSDDDEEVDPKVLEAIRDEQIKRARIGRFLRDDLKLEVTKRNEDRLTALAFMCVKFTTAYDYCSCLHGIYKRGYPLTQDGFVNFCARNGRNMKPGTLGQYHNAWKHYQRVTGKNRAADRVSAIVEAVQREAKRQVPAVRGSITEKMTLELIKQPMVVKEPKVRDLYILLSASGVRSNQLHGLRLNDCHANKHRPGSWIFSVVKNHKGKKATKVGPSEAFELHHTNPFWCDEISRILSEVQRRKTASETNPYVLPAWHVGRGARERTILKAASKILNWPKELTWVLHSFRNGACHDAFMRNADKGAIEAFVAAQEMSGHVTLQMLRHYAIPNSDRIKYQQMRLDHCMLRATGVVSDSLTGRYVPGGDVPSMVSQSTMKRQGTNAEWKARLEQVKKEKKGRGFGRV